MRTKVSFRQMDANPALREYAEKKISKAASIVDAEPMSADIVLHMQKNPAIERKADVEVTMTMKGRTVHVEERAEEMMAAIDLVSDKLERRLRKYKSRITTARDKGVVRLKTASGTAEIEESIEEPNGQLVKTKQVEMSAMNAEEAILQLELLGHDFFVFEDSESGMPSVLYRRNDGDYGLIQPAS